MKTIGIIGMGSVGISVAWILQQAGLNIIAFKKNQADVERFESLMKAGKIKVINNTNIKIQQQENPVFNVKVTSSLQEIAEQSDLILHCSLFPQNVNAYHFNESQIEVINQKNTPVLAFPGKLGSSWFIGQGKINVGLIGYSPVFATKDVIEASQETIITIKNFKSKIPLAHNDDSLRLYLLSCLNKYFNLKQQVPTFIDGGHNLKTALTSPVPTINASAICDNVEKLIQSNGKTIKTPIYALSKKYSLLFQEAFNEQLLLAKLLRYTNLSTITDWLQNRSQKIVSDNVTDMLDEIYKDKNITLDQNDRRITESYYALLFFNSFAETLGINTFATKELLYKLSNLHLALKKTASLKATSLSIQKAGISYAENILNTEKMKKKNRYHVSVG